jgi:hypothetical protein
MDFGFREESAHVVNTSAGKQHNTWDAIYPALASQREKPTFYLPALDWWWWGLQCHHDGSVWHRFKRRHRLLLKTMFCLPAWIAENSEIDRATLHAGDRCASLRRQAKAGAHVSVCTVRSWVSWVAKTAAPSCSCSTHYPDHVTFAHASAPRGFQTNTRV